MCYKPEMYTTHGGGGVFLKKKKKKKREPQIHIFRELFRKHSVAINLEIRE